MGNDGDNDDRESFVVLAWGKLYILVNKEQILTELNKGTLLYYSMFCNLQ